MPHRILFDVGGHLGQTVDVALNGLWRFDHIHTFEPEPHCASSLRLRFENEIRCRRVTVHQAALGARNETLRLYGDNAGGSATIIAGMLADELKTIEVPCIDVNSFIKKHVFENDKVYIKLNCEGGEVAIVKRLCELSNKRAIISVMADFDIVKARHGFYIKRSTMRQARLEGLPLVLSEDVMVGATHAQRVSNWLAHFPELAVEPVSPRHQTLRRKIRYLVRDLRSAIGGHGRTYK